MKAKATKDAKKPAKKAMPKMNMGGAAMKKKMAYGHGGMAAKKK